MRGVDLGAVELEGTLNAPFLTTDGSGVPADPAVLPSYRVYGAGKNLMPGGTGSLSKVDTGTITGASNASPIAVTSANHNLQTGSLVSITGVGGNSNANNTWRVTRVDANTFTLDGSAGNAAYTSGGTWHTAGLHKITLAVPGGSGYEAGRTYHVLIAWRLGITDFAALCPFRVA